MSTRFALARHGACALMDSVLFGRAIDVQLDDEGMLQAQALGERFRGFDDLIVRASPRRRTRQTAETIARAAGRELRVDPDLDELDFGRWAGMSFAALAGDPEWRRWNEARGRARTPAGDSMAAAQARVIGCMQRLHEAHPGRTIALVTHAEIIRAAILYCLDAPLGDYLRFEIAPGSVTTLMMDSDGISLLEVNESGFNGADSDAEASVPAPDREIVWNGSPARS